MSKGFNECIELEALDELVRNNHFELAVTIQLFLIDELNANTHINEKYSFSVISFGFMGYYPVIGVQYADENAREIENFVIKELHRVTTQYSIHDIVKSSIKHGPDLRKILKQLKKDNDDFHSSKK